MGSDLLHWNISCPKKSLGLEMSDPNEILVHHRGIHTVLMRIKEKNNRITDF